MTSATGTRPPGVASVTSAPDSVRILCGVVNSSAQKPVGRWVPSCWVQTGSDQAAAPPPLSGSDHTAGSSSFSGSDRAAAAELRDSLVTLPRAHSGCELDPGAVPAAEDHLRRVAVRYPLVPLIGVGSSTLAPVHDGAFGLFARVLGAAVDLSYRGAWPRVKMCKNESCDRGFFDKTRNTSALYCSPACSSQRRCAPTATGRKRPDVELRHLHTFVAVAEEQSFSRAADRLRVAQSAVSRTVQALERELGRPLFERSRHHVALTKAGLNALTVARATLETAESLRSAATCDDMCPGR